MLLLLFLLPYDHEMSAVAPDDLVSDIITTFILWSDDIASSILLKVIYLLSHDDLFFSGTHDSKQ